MDPHIATPGAPDLLATVLKNTANAGNAVHLESVGLDHSNQALQGTETLVLREPSPMASSTLPRELLEGALLLLDIKSILTCRLINKTFNEIIQSSVLLQYYLACKAAGVTDNYNSPLFYAERLEALKKREDAWRTLKPAFETTIPVDHNQPPIGIYDLTGGAFFLNDNNQKDLYYFHLPSSLQDNPAWIKMKGHGLGENWPGIFVNFTISFYEHDLMINVVSSELQNQAGIQLYSLDLVLLNFSTVEFHPLAHQPRIHIQKLRSTDPTIMLEVAGDNLAILIRSEDDIFFDELFIFDWKTGNKRLEHETIDTAYPDLVFVSPEILLIPNVILSHFEIWYIPPSCPDHKPPVQILCLKLPEISSDYSFHEINCRGEPVPYHHSLPYTTRPFIASPKDSIIVINIRLVSLFLSASYSLVMHRSALLDMIQKWTSSSLLEQSETLPVWFTNEVVTDQIAGLNDVSVRPDAKSQLLSTTPHSRTCPRTPESQNSPASPTSDISSGTASLGSSAGYSMSQYHFPQVKWTDWGPPITRWLKISNIQVGWIMNSAGQRYASLDPNPRDQSKLMLSVVDFNPYNIRRNAESRAQREENVDSGKEEEEEHDSNSDDSDDSNEEGGKGERGGLEKLDQEGVFSEDVYMGLKCVTYHTQEEYDFDVVLMDEERLLGLKFPIRRKNRIGSIKVLYFG